MIFSGIGKENLAGARQRLKMDNKTYLLAEAIAKCGYPAGVSRAELGLHLVSMTDEAARASAAIAESLGALPDGALTAMDGMIEEDFPRSTRHLKLDGREIEGLGFAGREIGDAQHAALIAVAKGEIENEREALIAFLRKMKG